MSEGEVEALGAMLDWGTGLCSALAIVLCTILFVNTLSISYYPLVHRLTSEQTIALTLISPEMDIQLTRFFVAIAFAMLGITLLRSRHQIEALIASLGSILSIALLPNAAAILAPVWITVVLGLSYRSGALGKLLTCTLLTFVILEAISLSYWIIYPFFRLDEISQATMIQSGFFYAFAKLNPFFLAILIFSWALAPITSRFLKIEALSFVRSGVLLRLSSIPKSVRGSERFNFTRGTVSLVLLLAILTSWAVVIYPYLPSVNPSEKYISVDALYYEASLTKAENFQGVDLLRYLFGINADRTLPIAIMYCVTSLTGLTPSVTVKALPLVLTIMLVLSAYFVVVRATYDQGKALYSALLSGTSIVVTVGMYAGYYANWLAISMALFALGFVFSYLDSSKPSHFVAACLLLILAELSHPWTWIFFSAAMVLLFLHHVVVEVAIMRRDLEGEKVVAFLFPALISLAFDLFKSSFIGIGATGVEVSYATVSSGLRIMNLFLLGSNVSYLLEVLVGGLTSNTLYLVVAAFGVIISVGDGQLSKLFTVLLFMISLPFLFLDPILQSRLLYTLPLHLLFAAGAYKGFELLSEREFKPGAMMFLVLCLLSSANYALRSAINLV